MGQMGSASLTQRVLLEKQIQGVHLICISASQEILRLLWNKKIHYSVHKSPPPTVHNPNTFRKIHFNIILLYRCFVCTLPSLPCPTCSYILSCIFARSLLIAVMMEAVSTSETSVNFYQNTRRSISEDSHLETKLFYHKECRKGIQHRFVVVKLSCFVLRRCLVRIPAEIYCRSFPQYLKTNQNCLLPHLL
jgi:hypothetical protein